MALCDHCIFLVLIMDVTCPSLPPPPPPPARYLEDEWGSIGDDEVLGTVQVRPENQGGER